MLLSLRQPTRQDRKRSKCAERKGGRSAVHSILNPADALKTARRLVTRRGGLAAKLILKPHTTTMSLSTLAVRLLRCLFRVR